MPAPTKPLRSGPVTREPKPSTVAYEAELDAVLPTRQGP